MTPDRSLRRIAVPIAGAIVLVAGTLGVIGLADAATESDGLAAFDPALTANAVSRRTPALTAVARTLTFIGSTPVLVILTLAAALLLWRWTSSLRGPAVLILAMIGSSTLTYVLKTLVGRKRPDVTVVLGPVEDTFAFPSGHTLNTTVFFITLAALVWGRLRSLRNKILIAVFAVTLSIGVGFSRVYLGYHWATDVLAGWTVALTWLSIVLSVAYLTAPSGDAAPPPDRP
ncbi:phosphatase PAP2 family protein [Kribbella pittospori]|uniref:Phosphatase PAP2 family protein n=1 Tax=Kribbella pittospori TaxID=722689 RepID=A0A4R0JWC1_9ACTN|nr:phosphatase PAP2 family protein [Kribbella pittospori]TCC49538.1 phosphatase PAP2 family protein [Kribbella pittospori]